jgi:hypothetical protein
MAQTCPNCGGFDISQETDRFHCLDCGNYFTYDDQPAEAGAAEEPLFTPEARDEPAQEHLPPTDHAALAADVPQDREGLDVGPVPGTDETSAEQDTNLQSLTKAQLENYAEENNIEGVNATTQTKDEMISNIEGALADRRAAANEPPMSPSADPEGAHAQLAQQYAVEEGRGPASAPQPDQPPTENAPAKAIDQEASSGSVQQVPQPEGTPQQVQ